MTGEQEYLSGSVQVADSKVVVAVVGEVDLATVAQFRTLLDEALR